VLVPRVLAPGQRWRSHSGGNTIVIVERCDDRWYVHFDGSQVAAAIDTADLLDDYEFLELVETPSVVDAVPRMQSPR
jgi:hypothetical protein